MEFVQLTHGNQQIWINPAAIAYISPNSGGGAVVSFMGSKDAYVGVKESPAHVAALATRALSVDS